MLKGRIIKGIAGFYYVKSGETVYRCKARGIFKERGIKPAVGDLVEVEVIEGNDDSLITEILPRKNCFVRPFIANVDCFVIVAAVVRPAPILPVIDRFLVMAAKADTDVIFCINKCDLASENGSRGQKKAAETRDELLQIYSPIYPAVCLQKDSEEGLDTLTGLIKGKTVALAGASGVGKSTILNRLIPHAWMETGQISEKSQRGKHTTRHSELFALDASSETMIFDTPGFTSFDILEAEEDELQHLYPDIARYIGKCRYDNCRHMAEPDCKVKEAVENGLIHPKRYESYKQLMEEIRK